MLFLNMAAPPKSFAEHPLPELVFAAKLASEAYA
jgi:hypothetical protein